MNLENFKKGKMETQNDLYLKQIIETSKTGGDNHYRFCLKCKGVVNSRKENQIEASLVLVNGEVKVLPLVLTVIPRTEFGYWKFDIALSKIDVLTVLDEKGEKQETVVTRSLIRFYLEDFDNFQPKIYGIFLPTGQFLTRFADAVADAFRSSKRQPRIVRQVKRKVRNYDVKLDKMITLKVRNGDKHIKDFEKIFTLYAQSKKIEPIS